MTPLQLAQSECANYLSEGGCLGAHIAENGRISHCTPKPRCVLRADERCAYFEACLAPMADMVKEPHRAKAIQEAVASYRAHHVVANASARRCPDCGGVLPKFRQLCSTCAHKRRKATYRQSQYRRRKSRPAPSTEVPKTASNALGKPRHFRAVCRNSYQGSPTPKKGSASVDTAAPEAHAGRSAAA